VWLSKKRLPESFHGGAKTPDGLSATGWRAYFHTLCFEIMTMPDFFIMTFLNRRLKPIFSEGKFEFMHLQIKKHRHFYLTLKE
jgi:hypothetical protein